MIIGVPKETKDQEYRVGMTPDGVRRLTADGHRVLVEPGAGVGSGFADEDYRTAGAQLISSKVDLFSQADLIVKVKEPLPDEYGMFREGQTLLTFLHLAVLPDLTNVLMGKRITAIGYESIQAPDNSLPILRPMSEIAGRMAVQVGAQYLEKVYGGRGVLLGGVPGVAPGEVVVLGAGVVGSEAARIAVGMGARVTVFNLDIDRLRALDALYQGRIATVASHQPWIDEAVLRADLVVGAVLVRGARAPRLVSRQLVSRMKRGAVVVDVSVDQGGCIETTRPTSHSDPVYEIEGVIHYCVPNMPGIVPRTSTLALTNATLPVIVHLASAGVEQALRSDPSLARGVNVAGGKITCQGVADALSLPYHPFAP